MKCNGSFGLDKDTPFTAMNQTISGNMFFMTSAGKDESPFFRRSLFQHLGASATSCFCRRSSPCNISAWASPRAQKSRTGRYVFRTRKVGWAGNFWLVEKRNVRSWLTSVYGIPVELTTDTAPKHCQLDHVTVTDGPRLRQEGHLSFLPC